MTNEKEIQDIVNVYVEKTAKLISENPSLTDCKWQIIVPMKHFENNPDAVYRECYEALAFVKISGDCTVWFLSPKCVPIVNTKYELI